MTEYEANLALAKRKPDHKAYEAGKRWLQEQAMTPQQYERAIRELAARCGL